MALVMYAIALALAFFGVILSDIGLISIGCGIVVITATNHYLDKKVSP